MFYLCFCTTMRIKLIIIKKKVSPSFSRWVYLFIYDVVMFIIYCTWKFCSFKSSLREELSQLGNAKYWSGVALWIINFDILTRARYSTHLILHNDTEIITVLNYNLLLTVDMVFWLKIQLYSVRYLAPLLAL